jgi:6-pyruvoyl-tetrahydropterin synthase
MYDVGIKRRFYARHYLVGDFGEETQPHGHQYEAEWSCRVEGLDENGFAVDIALMEEALDRVLERISGVLLNEQGYFQGRQASVEHLAVFLWLELAADLDKLGFDASRLIETTVKIWESETAWASYTTAELGS